MRNDKSAFALLAIMSLSFFSTFTRAVPVVDTNVTDVKPFRTCVSARDWIPAHIFDPARLNGDCEEALFKLADDAANYGPEVRTCEEKTQVVGSEGLTPKMICSIPAFPHFVST